VVYRLSVSSLLNTTETDMIAAFVSRISCERAMLTNGPLYIYLTFALLLLLLLLLLLAGTARQPLFSLIVSRCVYLCMYVYVCPQKFYLTWSGNGLAYLDEIWQVWTVICCSTALGKIDVPDPFVA